MIRARDLAEYIIDRCSADGKPVSNIVLNSMMYDMQITYLGMTDTFLFPEDIEAFGFGAAIPDIYYHYCGYGCMPIDSRRASAVLPDDISADEYDVIDDVIKRECNFDPWDFKHLLYEDTSVWAEAWRASSGKHHEIITTDMMRREAETRFIPTLKKKGN